MLRAGEANGEAGRLVAFMEMAQTWEKLADLHELSQRLKSSGVLLEKPALLGPAQDAEDASGRVS
jgi:hypothetical protein